MQILAFFDHKKFCSTLKIDVFPSELSENHPLGVKFVEKFEFQRFEAPRNLHISHRHARLYLFGYFVEASSSGQLVSKI